MMTERLARGERVVYHSPAGKRLCRVVKVWLDNRTEAVVGYDLAYIGGYGYQGEYERVPPDRLRRVAHIRP